MLYLVPVPTTANIHATLVRLGIRSVYVAPLMQALTITTPVVTAIRNMGHLVHREMCYELLPTGVPSEASPTTLAGHGLSMDRLSGHKPRLHENIPDYGQRVRSWFTDYFMPRLYESPVPTIIVAPYDVCMLIAEYLTKFQQDRAILPTVPAGLRRTGAILEYVNRGMALQATRFIY